MKIGQEIIVKEDFEVTTLIGGKALTVKKGDKAFLDSKGLANIITGEARGKVSNLYNNPNKNKMDGYDHANISKLIFTRLKNYFDMEDMLNEYEIADDDIIEQIEDVLMDIF
ncbi:MAG: hypothetical protein ACRDD7_06770 [Peptostreptococcaceae bacterium]